MENVHAHSQERRSESSSSCLWVVFDVIPVATKQRQNSFLEQTVMVICGVIDGAWSQHSTSNMNVHAVDIAFHRIVCAAKYAVLSFPLLHGSICCCLLQT